MTNFLNIMIGVGIGNGNGKSCGLGQNDTMNGNGSAELGEMADIGVAHGNLENMMFTVGKRIGYKKEHHTQLLTMHIR